jgi:hypothetical protein
MAKNSRVKKIKGGLQVGDRVPRQNKNCNPGNVGKYHEEVLKRDGINVQATGIDLPDLECEIKTRNDDAVSPFTVTRMSRDEIISTPYNQSKIRESIKNLDITRYKDGVVTSRTIHHWDKDPIIDKDFENAYEYLRNKIISGNCSSYIGGPRNSGFSWEETPTNGTYAWRIKDSKLEKLERITSIMSSGLIEFQ